MGNNATYEVALAQGTTVRIDMVQIRTARAMIWAGCGWRKTSPSDANASARWSGWPPQTP